jgi:hypothetical protein
MTTTKYITEIQKLDNYSTDYLNNLEIRDLDILLENLKFNAEYNKV